MKHARTVAALMLMLVSIGCGDPPTTPTPPPTVGGSALRIDSVTPNVGSTLIPTHVTIRGAGFVSGAAVSIGIPVIQSSVISPEQLTAVFPARSASVATVMVTNPDGRSARLENGFRFDASLPVEPMEVRISGQLLAGSSDTPVAGASMQLQQTLTSPAPIVTADDDGRFTLTGTLPRGVERLFIEVSRAGLGSWLITAPPDSSDQVVLRVPGLLLIRAGRTIRGEIERGPAQMACTFESVPCVRLVVDGPPGSLIDLELIPESGQEVGLIRVETFLAPTVFPTRLIVPPTTMWIMGGFGKFTVKAHHVESAARR